jgi:UPF0755 protein
MSDEQNSDGRQSDGRLSEGKHAPESSAKPDVKPDMAVSAETGTKTAEAPSAPTSPAPKPTPDVTPPIKTEAASDAAQAASASLFRRRATLQSPKQTLQPQAPPAPPTRKKRREGTLSAMSGFLSFLLLALVAGVFGLIAGQHKLKEPGPLTAEKILYFAPRTELPEILARLEREGVIDSPLLMNMALLVEGARGRVKPGEYLFKQKISLREVMDEMVNGRQLMHGVTIPEGLTSDQIVQRLRDNELLAGDVMDMPKEGALLPETYKVPRAYPRSKLLAKMQDDQRKLVDQIWAKRARDLPFKTPYELVTLASIVEKETGKADERPRVAAVFVNRLRKGMRLQSDPTIVYGIVGGKATLGRGILRAEVEKWTPYNTYAIDGLPPGPIANPGKAALEATANPLKTQELYFVADGTGGHVFADTLEQHSRNVQRWRQIEQEQKDKNGGDADRAVPGSPPPAAPKNDKRGDAGFGRLLDLAARCEDYPPDRGMAADDGATHRLGRIGPREAAFVLGGHDDRSGANARRLAALRPARAFFTEASAQPRPAAAMDPSLFAADAVAPAAGEETTAHLREGMARESADGRALAESEGGDIASYPVSAKLRAEQKARAVKLGLSAGSDQLPADVIEDRAAAAEETPAPAATASALPARPSRPRAFDASEGTALDPLRDKSWDLSSPKTVPAAASFR